MGHCFKTYFSYKFDQPERIHDQAIMRFSKSYFEPSYCKPEIICGTRSCNLSCTSYMGKQGRCSGESTRLPPVWPGFKSWCRRHMWLEFVVGSLLNCSDRFSPGSPVFPSP